MPIWLIIFGAIGAAAAFVLFGLIARRAQTEVSGILASLPESTPVLVRRIDRPRLRITRRAFADRVQMNVCPYANFDAYTSQQVHERLAAAGWAIEQ